MDFFSNLGAVVIRDGDRMIIPVLHLLFIVNTFSKNIDYNNEAVAIVTLVYFVLQ